MGIVVFFCMLVALYGVKIARGENIVVMPSLSIDERYDSNVRFAGTGQDAESDFLTILSPQITAVSEQKNLNLNGLYRLASQHYSKNKELNYISHTVSLSMNARLSQNSSLSAGDSFAYTQYSLEAADTGIQTRRTDITSNAVFVTTKHELSSQASVSMTLRGSLSEFKEPAMVDTKTYSAALTGDYRISAASTVNTTYEYSKFLFDTNENVENHSLQIGITERPAEDISFDVSGGIVYMPEVDGQYNWTAGANITKRFQQAAVSIGYTRGVSNTSGLTDEVGIADRVSLRWNQTLAKSLDMTISGDISKNRSEPSARVDMLSYNAGISATWQLYAWMAIGTGYSHFQQWDDNTLTGDVARDQVFMNVTVTPAEWRL